MRSKVGEQWRQQQHSAAPALFFDLTNVYISIVILNIINSTKKTTGTPSTTGFYHTTWVLYHTMAKQVRCVPAPVMGTITMGTGMV